MIIFRATRIVDTANAAFLQSEDDAYVASGIIFASLQFSAILGSGSGHSVFVEGTVIGGRSGLLLGATALTPHTQQVFIKENGIVNGSGEGFGAIGITGYDSLVDNDGHLSGRDYGVSFNGTSVRTRSELSNDGTISGGTQGIVKFGTEALRVVNHGTIEGGTYSFLEASGNAVELIVNRGRMVGDVSLGGGNDLFDGRLGRLTGSIFGGAGVDILYGGADDDNIVGGTEADQMSGGAGNDLYAVDNIADVVIEAAGGGADTIQTTLSLALSDYQNVENVRLLGVGRLSASGDAGANKLFGNANANVLSGLDGNDMLAGGNNADRLIGGTGSDRLFGQAGNDLFTFTRASDSGVTMTTADRIMDFASVDRIDLSALDANPFAASDQAFTLDAGGTFSVGEIRQARLGADLIVSLNLDADAQPEMALVVANVTALTAADFIL